jgi:hypothetical protein
MNNNGWGIPSTEADNAINTLKNAVIRICPRNQPHGCDFSDDPFSEIGHIADAWQENNEIRVVANITDSVASQKIQDQTWSNGWSIYSHYQNEADGWLSGVDIKSLTLVRDPAWDKATWTKAASEGETSSLLFYKPFKILVGNTMDEKTTPTTDGGGIPAEFDALLKEKDSIINELNTNKSSMETEFQALKEQYEAVNGELSTLKSAAASKDAELSKSITLEEADKRIAAAIDKYKEDLARNEALGRLAAARKARGYETSFEEYAKDPVSRITKLAEDFENMKSASKEPVYPTTPTSGGFTVGNKNSGKWEA